MRMERRVADLKPKHRGGYTEAHAALCERTLVTLIRGRGPWKEGVYVIGGLVPRYLIRSRPGLVVPPYVGTMDVDLVLNLDILGSVEAYRRLEQNLKNIGFERATNEEGQGQHFRCPASGAYPLSHCPGPIWWFGIGSK